MDEQLQRLSLREFLSYTLPYVIISLVACYVPAMLIWILPFAK